ncbi:MAG TPA: RNA polymerase sigma factor [Rhodanobacteraceae bacterium]|nr:RNA polymerase sigma factor [Rhodanobacteraceae bacterium]
MFDDASLIAAQHESRRRFLELVAEIRPELHRYCARMVGSITDGEDVVQDALARAYYALPEMETMPEIRPWLFRIAHHRALDHLKRYDVRMREPLDAEHETADAAADPDEALAREEATRAAITRFVDLAPAQRSAVVLKDVLGHSLEEIGALLDLTLPAVKAALHRGRDRLRESRPATREKPHAASPLIARYAELFNARDWDGVRALLAEDVRLDLVSRVQRAGKRNVGNYFSNYDRFADWYFVPAWLDGREVIAVHRDPQAAQASYFIELALTDRGVVAIRDYRYVPYIAREARHERIS